MLVDKFLSLLFKQVSQEQSVEKNGKWYVIDFFSVLKLLAVFTILLLISKLTNITVASWKRYFFMIVNKFFESDAENASEEKAGTAAESAENDDGMI